MASQRDLTGKSAVPPTSDVSVSSDLHHLYEIGVRRLPPVINLLDTPASRLLRARHHRSFMKFTRATFGRFSNLNRACIVVVLTMWAAPAAVGQIVTPLMSIGCFPVLFLSVVLMSSELLTLLVQQHEFWLFTITNACNWTIAAVLLNDARAVGCVVCFCITELVILMDANFRTVVVATKSCVLWVPAICIIIVVCATQTVDIDPVRFHKPAFPSDRVLPCSVLRCELVLQRMRVNDADVRARYGMYQSIRDASGGDPDAEYELTVEQPTPDGAPRITSFQRNNVRVFAPVVSTRSRRRSSVRLSGPKPVSHPSAGSNRTLPKTARQQLRIITPTLAFLDLRNTLWPRGTPRKTLPLLLSVLHILCGIAGLWLAAFTMYLLPASSHSTTTYLSAAIPTLSLVCTTHFVAPFVASCQRNLVRALARHFDLVFSSFQFTIASICLADMLSRDLRCLALVAWFEWLHWILLWDALMPAMHERFHFKKIYGAPVFLGILLGLVWIVYALFLNAYDALSDRTIADVKWSAFKVSISTSTFLVGRLNTILTWSVRLLWNAIRSDDDALSLL